MLRRFHKVVHRQTAGDPASLLRRQTVDTHSALLPWHSLQYTASLTGLGLPHAKDWNCLDVCSARRAVQPMGIYRMIGCVLAGQW